MRKLFKNLTKLFAKISKKILNNLNLIIDLKINKNQIKKIFLLIIYSEVKAFISQNLNNNNFKLDSIKKLNNSSLLKPKKKKSIYLYLTSLIFPL